MNGVWSDTGTELAFETVELSGHLVADPNGRPCHSVRQLFHKPSDTYVSPDTGLMKHAGSFTAFRTYARNGWLTELRNTRADVTPRDDGVELVWEPTMRHRVRTTVRICVLEPNIIDADIAIEGLGYYPDYELLFSNYVAAQLRGSAFVKHSVLGATEEHERIDVIDNPVFHGMYPFFPRDERAANVMTDGRGQRGRHYWKVACGRPYAYPVGMASDGRTLVMLMGKPEDVSSVGVTYWADGDASDDVAAHHALYLSLFARDLHPGDGWRTQVRLLVTDQFVTASEPLRYFRAFVEDTCQTPSVFQVSP